MNDGAGDPRGSVDERSQVTIDDIEQEGWARQQTQRALGYDWGGYDLASPWDTGYEIVAIDRAPQPSSPALLAAEVGSQGSIMPTVADLATPRRIGEHGRLRVERLAGQVVEQAARVIERGQPLDRVALERSLDDRLRQRVRSVINATGSTLAPALGGAPWSEGALTAARRAAGYSDVEFDAQQIRWAARGVGAEDRLCALTGAEAALVVSSHAGAALLALSTLAESGRIAVSRGDLVELSDGRRIVDVLRMAGARPLLVGAVNRTTLDDVLTPLERVLDGGEPVGGIYLVQHRLRGGAVEAPPVEALARQGVPLIVDHAIGAITAGANGLPTIAEAVDAGADAVCFAGDGRLGGPQSGIIVGRRAAIDRMRRHPLYPVLQLDKTLLAALEATVDERLRGVALPVDLMDGPSVDDLRVAVEHWQAVLADRISCRIVDVEQGDGRSPDDQPSVALAIDGPDPRALAVALARGKPAVMGRFRDGALLLDARTVVPLGRSARLLTALERAIEVVMEG